MKRYVIGFMFNWPMSKVVLIEKQRPDWQKGKWNGVGGHIELHEDPSVAMRREFQEETGLWHEDWKRFCILHGAGFELHAYYAISNAMEQVCTKTDERVGIHLANYPPDNIVPNTAWLIPMAMSFERGEHCELFDVCERNI